MKMDIESGPEPRVACILVNWNGWRDTVECIDALKQGTYRNFSIIVVDNGSTNDSVSQIKSAHPEVPIIETGRNLGCPSGSNVGFRHALAERPDFLWWLNNDTQPDPNALTALVAKAMTDRRLGAVASVCYYASDPSTVQAWAGSKVNLWTGHAKNTTVPRSDAWFDALYGASMLIARPAMEECGLLDEGFFHYWDETEFCLRLRKRGWRIAAAPDSRILHKVNASTGQGNPVLDRYFTASGLRTLRLHARAPRMAMTLFLATRFLGRIVRFQPSRCKNVWEGIQDYRRKLPVVPQIR